MKTILLTISIAVLSSSCATVTTSTTDYAPPIERTFKHDAVIAGAFDEVWDRIIAQLSSSFFVINNIDKGSRLVNVSFSSNTARDFADCGKTSRHFDFQGESRAFTYEAAGNALYRHVLRGGVYQNLPVVAAVTRAVSVEGRANLYVAPIDKASTKVIANAKYVLTVSVSGTTTQYTAFGTPNDSQAFPPSSSIVSFSSSESGVANDAARYELTPIKCVSTGELETRLLKLAQ